MKKGEWTFENVAALILIALVIVIFLIAIQNLEPIKEAILGLL